MSVQASPETGFQSTPYEQLRCKYNFCSVGTRKFAIEMFSVMYCFNFIDNGLNVVRQKHTSTVPQKVFNPARF